MKKRSYLLITLILLAISFTMTACGIGGNDSDGEKLPENCNHLASGTYVSDGDAHWFACANGCGEKLDYEKHVWGNVTVKKEASCEETGLKSGVCTVCNESLESEIPLKPHTVGAKYEFDETYHWKSCDSCGGAVDKEAHSPKTAKFNAEQHWKTCKCGFETEKENHIWVSADENGTSSLEKCEAEYCTAERVAPSSDHQCVYDDGEIIENSTCQKQGTIKYSCIIEGCDGYIVGSLDLADHDYSGAWESDAQYHWQLCKTCGEAPEKKSSHDYKEDTSLGEKVYKCECGATASGYILTAADQERMRYGIIALSYSENVNPAPLVRQMYNVAFSKTVPVNGTPEEIITGMFSATPTEYGLSAIEMTVPTLYGGTKLGSVTNNLKGESTLPDKGDLIVGDVLLYKSATDYNLCIYDGENILLLKDVAKKMNADEVLASLSVAELYAVLRPSYSLPVKYCYESTENSSELSDEQNALIETAKAYILRGYRLQYDDTRMSSTYVSSTDRGEFRWQIGLYAPEDYTSEKWGYTNCAGFTYDLYRNALGMDLGGLYTTADLASYYNKGGAVGVAMYPYNMVTANYKDTASQNAEKDKFMSTLKVGDLIVVRRESGGHVMMYIGNSTVVHSSGSSYNYSSDSEIYEPTVRYMNIERYLFDPESTNYVYHADNIVNQLCIVRPLDKYNGSIPENTLNRIENLGDIISEKLSSHREGMTVNKGEIITYSFKIKNIGASAKTLNITDKVPAGTAIVSYGDATLNGNELSWSVTVAPNDEITVSYSVSVTADEGEYIYGEDAKIGGVSHHCPGVYVKSTLTAAEQENVIAAVQKFKNSNPSSLKGIALADAIYAEAGLTCRFGVSDSELRSSLFVSTKDSAGSSSVWSFNTSSKYYEAVAPTLYGGRRFFTPMKYTSAQKINGDRTRLAREQSMVVGDVLVVRFSSSDGMYMYVGNGEFINLLNTSLASDTYTATVRLSRMNAVGNYFAVLRPSLMK